MESWNQLDNEQKSHFHNNVSVALAQLHGRHPPAALTSQQTSQPTNIAAGAHQLKTRGDEDFVTYQGSGLGFGLEEMEENPVSPAVSSP